MDDLIIIGGGPCGLSTAIAAARAGLTARVLEQGALVNTIVGYPLQTRFFSTADNLTIGDYPWPTLNPHPTRAEALAYYRTVAAAAKIPIQTHEPVTSVARAADGTFAVTSARRDGTRPAYAARAVVFAYGSYDTPNRLDAPGADLPKVAHYYTEGHPFYQQDVAVIGGGNSAAEAALDLFNHGARVTLIHQFADLDARVKPWVLADLRAWIDAGRIGARWESRVTDITPTSLAFTGPDGAATIPNDWVFALIGYRPKTTLMAKLGIALDDDAVPAHDPETFETNIPNAFVAGVLVSGALPTRIFIENGRHHGPAIIAALKNRWRP